MKKLIGLMMMVFLMGTAYAAPTFPKVKIDIGLPTKLNAYFLCIYGEGCLSIKASDEGKVFPLMMPNIANINQFVITDVRNMEVHREMSPQSCNIRVKPTQTLKITGNLEVRGNDVYVQGLRCSVA